MEQWVNKIALLQNHVLKNQKSCLEFQLGVVVLIGSTNILSYKVLKLLSIKRFEFNDCT